MHQKVAAKQLSNVPTKIIKQQHHKFVLYMNTSAFVEDSISDDVMFDQKSLRATDCFFSFRPSINKFSMFLSTMLFDTINIFN